MHAWKENKFVHALKDERMNGKIIDYMHGKDNEWIHR